MPLPPRARRRGLVPVGAVLALAVGAAAGCTAAVPVTAAGDATDPVCAAIVLATPTSLGDGLAQVPTTAQASRAWGSVSAPVVLRCGVTPPGPTTQRCVAVASADGTSIDWLLVPDDPAVAAEASTQPTALPSGSADVGSRDEHTGWTFTTFGRTPAVQVHVPAAVASTRSTSFLDLLGPAISRATVTGHCS